MLDLRGALTRPRDTEHEDTEHGERIAARRVPRPGAMVGDVIQHETLWGCTTCYACVYECPVLIEQVDDIVDMRRYLALMEGDMPASLATTLTNIERSGNPWKQPKRKRAAWTQGLDFEVPVMANVDEGPRWTCSGGWAARRVRPAQPEGHAGDRQHPARGRRQLCDPGRGGDLHRRRGPPRRQRVPVPDSWRRPTSRR